MVSWRRQVERRFTEVSRPRVPLPGGGSTRERWAILAELHGPEPVAGERWAVWAAAPPCLEAARGRVRGVKPYCSEARVCTRALVTVGESHDEAHSRRVAGLTGGFRRPHGERDLAAPGTPVTGEAR
jgi:hypothetical protein